jgi:hypothetical protein
LNRPATDCNGLVTAIEKFDEIVAESSAGIAFTAVELADHDA